MNRCPENTRRQALKYLSAGNYSEALKAFVSLQFKHGLRVSDILNIHHSDITNSNNIVIHQGKKSHKKIVRDDEFFDFWKNCRDFKINPFEDYDRFYIYRIYKRIGIKHTERGRKRNSVTHAPRKLLAQDMEKSDFDITEIQTALGHRGKRSTEYYLNEKRRQGEYKRRDRKLLMCELKPNIIKRGDIIYLKNE